MEGVPQILALNVGFGMPRPKDEPFHSALSAYLGDPETRELVGVIDSARSAMVQAVVSEDVDPQQKAAGILRYLPLARTLCSSWDSSNLAAPPQTWWTTGLGGAVAFQCASTFGCEVNMTLATLAAVLSVEGTQLAKRTPPEYRRAAAFFCKAAGIYSVLARNAGPFESEENPVELSEHIAAGMRDVCMASAHRLALAVAIGDGTQVKGGALKAKLCAGYVACLEEAIGTMRSRAGAAYDKLQGVFKSCLAFHVAMGRGLMWLFQAIGHAENTETGSAIYCVRQALLFLRERPSMLESGYPPLQGFLADYAAQVEAVRAYAQEQEQQYIHDNNTVYFNTIPDDLLAPSGATIMKESAFEMPDAEGHMMTFTPAVESAAPPTYTSAFGPAPPSYDSLIRPPGLSGQQAQAQAGGGGGGALQRSDSDLARELQERLNRGEDI